MYAKIVVGITAWTLSILAVSAGPLEWQVNELQYQHGRLEAPSFAGGRNSPTDIVTAQHASGWFFGDLFLFVDFLDDARTDSFNDRDYYGEAYLNFSLGKISGQSMSYGAIKDLGLIAGVNQAGDARIRKWLPGLRLSWDLPGFHFINSDFTAYVDDSRGLREGGAPREGDSFMIDINWAYPFNLNHHRFSIEGHAEYIGARTNELGQSLSHWVLLQPQFRYDLGALLLARPDHLWAGIEWQYWRNKLGDPKTDENALQALVVWRF